jgi:hypothetical protein
MIKSFTFVRPENPRARAAAGVTSITRPRVNGPRSLIRTTVERPFWVFVTRIIVPNGSERCAAVMFSGLNASPLVVFPPLSLLCTAWGTSQANEKTGRYREAANEKHAQTVHRLSPR